MKKKTEENNNLEEVVKFDHYWNTLKEVVGGTHSIKYGTDGIFEDSQKKVVIILETKRDSVNLQTNYNNIIGAIAQALAYAKRYLKEENILPRIAIIGNGVVFYVIDIEKIRGAFDFIDDDIAPSELFKNTPPDLKKYIGERLYKICSPPYGAKFLKNILKNILSKIDVNKIKREINNIDEEYDYFESLKIVKNLEKLTDHYLMYIFFSIIFGEVIKTEDDHIILIPHLKNKNIVYVDPQKFKQYYNSIIVINDYKKREKMLSDSDKFIDNIVRRNYGEFYTPKEWVDEAHICISKNLGSEWREKFTVWDPASGLNNLERDYVFSDLYCSTLKEADVNIVKYMGYNQEAAIFQYDFLNDDVDEYINITLSLLNEGTDKLNTIDTRLSEKLKNNKFMFFMNPPFGTPTGNYEQFHNINTSGSSKTKIRGMMHFHKQGKASKELYLQFLYRIILIFEKYKNKNMYICVFSPISFFTYEIYENFRRVFFSNFEFVDGFIFNKKYFNGASEDAVMFSVWKVGNEKKSRFNLEIKELIDGHIKTIGEKIVRRTTKKMSARLWVKDKSVKKLKDLEWLPYLKSGINVRDEDNDKNRFKRVYRHNFGFYRLRSRPKEISHSMLISSPYSQGSYTITSENILRVIALFSAQMLTDKNWTIELDDYLMPNIDHPEYEQWNNDSIVISLFHGQNSMTSLRKILYKYEFINDFKYMSGKEINIMNHFFWISYKKMMSFANNVGFNIMVRDIIKHGKNRIIYSLLRRFNLSPDAQEVLNMATSIVEDTIYIRKRLYTSYPEWSFEAWDASWAQIIKAVKFSEEQKIIDKLNDFEKLYYEFMNRMREGVSKFGFLK